MIKAQVVVKRNVLPQHPAALRREFGILIGEALAVGESVAKADAPVRTGFLRNSIDSERSGMTGWLRSRAAYSAHVNYGTRFMPARPYFTHGAEAMNAFFMAQVRTKRIERKMPRL